MFLKNILKEPNATIAKANEDLSKEKKDDEESNNKVYFMAYEINSPASDYMFDALANKREDVFLHLNKWISNMC